MDEKPYNVATVLNQYDRDTPGVRELIAEMRQKGLEDTDGSNPLTGDEIEVLQDTINASLRKGKDKP